jgi:hypothetical protein
MAKRFDYPAEPVPYQFPPLPGAFIGECGCYYPARLGEANALVAQGLVRRADTDIEGTPIYEPRGKQVTPEQIETALRGLREKRKR